VIQYWLTDKGYVVTDTSIKLKANHSSIGNTLIFGHGPTRANDITSIEDQVFILKALGVELDAASVSQEWKESLGLIPMTNPVKTDNVSDLSEQEVEKDRGSNQVAGFLMLAVGIFIGLVIAYYIT
jgi:hypothetical protein